MKPNTLKRHSIKGIFLVASCFLLVGCNEMDNLLDSPKEIVEIEVEEVSSEPVDLSEYQSKVYNIVSYEPELDYNRQFALMTLATEDKMFVTQIKMDRIKLIDFNKGDNLENFQFYVYYKDDVEVRFFESSYSTPATHKEILFEIK